MCKDVSREVKLITWIIICFLLTLQISHVHFLYRPCPDFPPIMLCTCLRSSLRVTAFGRVGGSALNRLCPADGVLAHLLLEKNMGVSEYLWSCHMSSQLSHR